MGRVAWISAVMVAWSSVVGAGQAVFDLKAMLETYARGDYDRAVQMAPADLGPMQIRFVQDGPAWVAAHRTYAVIARQVHARYLEIVGQRT